MVSSLLIRRFIFISSTVMMARSKFIQSYFYGLACLALLLLFGQKDYIQHLEEFYETPSDLEIAQYSTYLDDKIPFEQSLEEFLDAEDLDIHYPIKRYFIAPNQHQLGGVIVFADNIASSHGYLQDQGKFHWYFANAP